MTFDFLLVVHIGTFLFRSHFRVTFGQGVWPIIYLAFVDGLAHKTGPL